MSFDSGAGNPPPTPPESVNPPGGPNPPPGGLYPPPGGLYPPPGGLYPPPGGLYPPPGYPPYPPPRGPYLSPDIPPPVYPSVFQQAPIYPAPLPVAAPPNHQNAGFGQIFITVLLVLLAFVAGWLGNGAVNGNASTPASARAYAPTIWAAWNDINNNYVNTSAIDHQKMTYAMISAMVGTLGDTGHSRFLTPAEVAQLNQQLNNDSFVGIGVYLQTVQTTTGAANIIEATIPNSPASQSGLRPGDQIQMVGTTNTRGDSLDQLSPLIKGPTGTSVSLTIFRPSDNQTHTFTMNRASVTAPAIVSDYFPKDHIGYVQITGVVQGAASDLTKALKTLQSDGATSLILDLRGNGGGYVNEAIGIASDFLPANQVVFYEKDRSGTLTPQVTTSDGLHLNLPMAILVDNGTASAAEIITGAIHDNRPAVPVIGQQTFGTDTELVSFDLPDGSQLLLGIKEFLAPNKTQLKPGVGLTPTDAVALPTNSFPVNPLVLQELKLTESDVLNCKGISIDTQLIAAITALDPTQTSTCAPKG